MRKLTLNSTLDSFYTIPVCSGSITRLPEYELLLIRSKYTIQLQFLPGIPFKLGKKDSDWGQDFKKLKLQIILALHNLFHVFHG